MFGRCEHCEDYRQQRDRAQAELSRVLGEQASLLKEVLAVKRHDLGLPPAGFEPANPLAGLGKHTLSAIDRASDGFPDLRTHLLNFAIREAATMGEGEDADRRLAQRILDGDGA